MAYWGSAESADTSQAYFTVYTVCQLHICKDFGGVCVSSYLLLQDTLAYPVSLKYFIFVNQLELV